MMITVFFYSFVVFTVIQIIYYIAFSSFLFTPKNINEEGIEKPISVIIFAKNQAKNLEKLLPTIINQDYSKFEIVLINNASIDNTEEVLENFSKNYKNIKVLEVENNEAFWANKKYALTLGIKAAKYDHLLFTNADSKPVSKNWISNFNQKFNNHKTIVLGYHKFEKEKSLFNLFIRFENLIQAIKCFGFAHLRNSFMAFDGNFAYHKTEFFKVKGFINHIKIKKGESNLFIKDTSNKENTTICISKNSFTKTKVPKSFSTWFFEKRNNAIIWKKYKPKHQILLALFTISKLFFYVFASILFFFYSYKIMLGFVIAYFLIQYIVVGIASKKLKEPYLLFFLPFLEIGLLLIQISIFIANLISKPDHWK